MAIALTLLIFTRPSFSAHRVEELLQETHWGESSDELLRRFGSIAMRLPRPLDFGDSYVDVVLNGQTLGAVPIVVFLQMDKTTHRLKRIQLERPRHGVNPHAFRAVVGALHAIYGRPDRTCVVPVLPTGGYQAATEELWVRGNQVVSAIFRDTTLQAVEGCLFGLTAGPCGLTGQLLVRVGASDGNAKPDPCFLAQPVTTAP